MTDCLWQADNGQRMGLPPALLPSVPMAGAGAALDLPAGAGTALDLRAFPSPRIDAGGGGSIAAPSVCRYRPVGGSAGAEPEPEPEPELEASRLGDLGTAIRDGVSSVLPEMPASLGGRPSPPPSMYTEI